MDKKVEQQGFDAGSERGKLHWNAPDITKLEFPATAAGIGHSRPDGFSNYQVTLS